MSILITMIGDKFIVEAHPPHVTEAWLMLEPKDLEATISALRGLGGHPIDIGDALDMARQGEGFGVGLNGPGHAVSAARP